MDVDNGSIINDGGSNSHYEICDISVFHSLLKMEALTAFCTMVLLFLALFGTYRRRYNSDSMLHRLLWFSSTMSYGVIAVALGVMNSSKNYHDLLGLWAVYLLTLIGGTDTVTAFEFQDIEKGKANLLYFCAKSLLAGLIVKAYPPPGKLQLGAWVLYLLAFTRTRELGAANLNVSKSFGLGEQSKLVADYMSDIEPHLSADAEAEPTSMKGYKYIFYGEKHAAGAGIGQPLPLSLVTIDQVWQALHGLGDRIRDTCLSFALFKMIKRSLAGLDMAEKDEPKTWRLVRDGLLSKEDGERAFRVVEVELGFLFEYFYTKYSLLHSKEFICIRIPVSLSVIVSCLLCIIWLGNYKPTDDHCALIPKNINVDVLMTGVILGVHPLLELIQLINLATTNWFKMLLVSIYVKQDSILQSSSKSHNAVKIRMFIQMICLTLIKTVEKVDRSFRVRCLRRPWMRSLRQYSLLESYRYGRHRSIGGRLLGSLLRGVVDKPRLGLEPAKFVPLCPEIKRAVVDRLRSSWPHLRRGDFSLLQNRNGDELSWACVNLETCIHTILVWHVATTLCEPPPPARRWWTATCPGEKRRLKRKLHAEEAPYGTHLLVATQLSKYCAYLVAFAPELLPGNPYLTGIIFDNAVADATTRLWKCRTLTQRHERARALAGECTEEAAAASGSIICLGSILANQLEMMGEGKKWKMLADFWAELILFVAPSGQPWAHVKYLSRGGEFISHLWALLYHSGISDRSSNCFSQY